MAKEIFDLRKSTGTEVIEMSEIDNSNDIDGIAALIEACDQVVSIDNMVVSLAGSLGKKTRVLLPFNHDWCWGTLTNSYWYNSVKLYRQSRLGDWGDPLKKMEKDLKDPV